MRRLLQPWLITASCILLIVALIVGTEFGWPSTLFAQGTEVVISVSLRDVAGAGVGGATITIRDLAGSVTLTRGTTDAQGMARLTLSEPPKKVRIAADGRLSSGISLFQYSPDADGMLLFLNGPAVHLDLRVEPDGAVILDPETMISADVPLISAPLDTAKTYHGLSADPVAAAAPAQLPMTSGLDLSRFGWVGVLIGGALALGIVALGRSGARK